MRAGTRAAIVASGLLGATGVALGAAAAHLPATMLDPRHRAMLDHAVAMQIWHALALLGAALARAQGVRLAGAACLLFLLGTVLFCGGVDALAFGLGWPARAAPVGGTLLILAWLLLAAGALRPRDPTPGQAL